MPFEKVQELTEEQKEYLDRNWDSAKGLDGFTEEEKEDSFRGEAKKKKSIGDDQIEEYIRDKKNPRDEKAA